MGIVEELKEKALTTGDISREEALLLAEAPLEELAAFRAVCGEARR